MNRHDHAEVIAHFAVPFLTFENDVCLYANDAARAVLGRDPVGARLDDLLKFCQRGPDRFKARTSSGRMVRGFSHPLPDGLVTISFADFTEELRAQREAMALARMASGVTWGGSLDDTMGSLAQTAAEAVEAVASAVLLVDGERAVVAGSYNVSTTYLDCLRVRLSMQPTQSFFANAMETRQIVVKQYAREELLNAPEMAPATEYLRDAPWDTVVVVPMYYRDTRLGALSCYFDASRSRDEEEQRFLQVIADQAAVLVQNARLIDEVRDKALLQERQRLARELHDSVSQALYGIALGARTARTLADRDPQAVKEPLDYVLSLAEAALAEMRALIFELRPETLDSEGLVAALERHVSAVKARHRLEVDSQLDTEPTISSDGRHALYRVAQEALNNIVKHAAASHVDLRLATDEDTVKLSVADDGRGFAGTGDLPGHLGLRSMRERMQSVGGTLEIESLPGRGTRVLATLPASPR